MSYGDSRDPAMKQPKPLIVMPANNTHWLVHYWQGLYGNLGHLYGPAGKRDNPKPHLPYALDNGAYGAFTHGREWDEQSFLKHLEFYAHNALRPRWVVVPDVVANATATFEKWELWASKIQDVYNVNLALAVQDGMTTKQVNDLHVRPDVIFVGGSTEWKWLTVGEWALSFPRVHVGRVNTIKGLEICASLGVESCDGTGWFRGNAEQLKGLGRFLALQSGINPADVDRLVYHSRIDIASHPALPLSEVA